MARPRLALGSTNPVKRAAVERVAADLFPGWQLATAEVPSGVPAQPRGDEETARGARARAAAAQAALDADYGVGIESGVAEGPGGRLYAVSWAAAVDRVGKVGLGASERFALPAELAERLRAGAELGPLLDELFGIPGLSRRQGAVGILTQGRRDRAAILEPAVLHAFIALLEPWR